MVRRVLFPVMVALLVGIASYTGAASAQTTDFNAKVNGHITKPSGGCPEGADLCGQAAIDPFGSARYLIVFTSFEPTSVLSSRPTGTLAASAGPGRCKARPVSLPG